MLPVTRRNGTLIAPSVFDFDSLLTSWLDAATAADHYNYLDEQGVRHYEFEMPGLPKDNIQLTLVNGALEMRAVRAGRKPKTFTWRCPYRVASMEQVSAELSLGILYLSLSPESPTTKEEHRIMIR